MLMDLIVHTRACHQTNTLELGEMWETQVVSDFRDSIWRGGATPRRWSAFSAASHSRFVRFAVSIFVRTRPACRSG